MGTKQGGQQAEETFRRFEEAWLSSRGFYDPGLSSVEKGHRFCREAFAGYVAPGEDVDAFFEDRDEELYHLDGKGDGAVDIAWFQKDAVSGDKTLYVVQSKYGTSYAGEMTLYDEFAKFQKHALYNPDGEKLNADAKLFYKKLEHFLDQATERDKVIWLVLTVRPIEESCGEALRLIADHGHGSFPGVEFEVLPVSLRDVMRRSYGRPPFVSAVLRFLERPQPDREGKVYIGAVSLADLAEFMGQYEREAGDINLLYSENIRLEQGSSRINRRMRETILKEPHMFGLYNNGITVIASEVENFEGGSFRLRGASVINGCQTTRSLYNVLHDPKDPYLIDSEDTVATGKRDEWRRLREEAFVMVKLIETGEHEDDDELVYRITRYANSQNAIGTNEMLGQNDYLKHVQAEFSRGWGVFLEVKQGGWAAERQKQLALPPKARTHYADNASAKDVMKAAAAIYLRKPGMAASGIAPFVPDADPDARSKYKRFMYELPAKDYYAGYRVLWLLDRLGIKFSGKTAEQHWLQTRFLTAFLFADAVRRLLAAEKGLAASGVTDAELANALIALVGGWERKDTAASELVERIVRNKVEHLYLSYLVGQDGQDAGFIADWGSSNKNDLLKRLDGDKLPPAMAAAWGFAMGAMTEDGSPERSLAEGALHV